ncbi:uncharacterized protein ATNIH1004_009730 [Aspergillus tanneri]|nr:uncharacterized protein ATNIH1004_009730 [Aspergillus tanneri]KAA8642968.1 hypothetical protein ATNIH1004_009730 [Aspergillus tanneri]
MPLPRLYPVQSNNVDIIELAIQSFIPGNERSVMYSLSDHEKSRICGSWMETLPGLQNQATADSVLSRAIKALGASIVCQTKQQGKISSNCSQTYYAAIRAVRKSFTTALPQADLIAAVMCLTLVEVMVPESAVALEAHVKGAGLLLLAYGPESCQCGVLHKLFVGFRPLLTMEAFRHRQPIFLSSQAWIDVPFSIYNPSPMQSLLNEAVIIPSLLQQIDALLDTPCLTQISEVTETIRSIIDVLTRLEKWDMNLRYQSDKPCYWTQGTTPKTQDPLLWYPNITMANVFTHLWTFRIICLCELMRLSLFFPGIALEELSRLSGLEISNTVDQIATLATQICMSMEYLMQDEMKLFGPASTFFPLQVAHEKLRTYGPNYQGYVTYVEEIVLRLVQKGLRSASILIFGHNTWNNRG